MKNKKVNIPIYSGKLHMYLVPDWGYLNSIYNTNMEEGFGAYAFKHIDKNKEDNYIVAFLEGQAIPKTITHEAVHIVNLIFVDRGINQDLYNDEPQAYLTGWVVGEIVKFINK